MDDCDIATDSVMDLEIEGGTNALGITDSGISRKKEELRAVDASMQHNTSCWGAMQRCLFPSAQGREDVQGMDEYRHDHEVVEEKRKSGPGEVPSQFTRGDADDTKTPLEFSSSLN